MIPIFVWPFSIKYSIANSTAFLSFVVTLDKLLKFNWLAEFVTKIDGISIFEKLCLKYPEKRAYFAAQIEKLKNQQVK